MPTEADNSPDTSSLEAAKKAADQLSPTETDQLIGYLQSRLQASVPEVPQDTDAEATTQDDLEDDESEDFYNDLDGEDDIIAARAARPSRGQRAAKTHTGPAKARVRPIRQSALSSGMKFALLAAVLLGMGTAIWFAGGNPTETNTPAATTHTNQTANVSQRAEQAAALYNSLEEDPNDIEARLALGAILYELGDMAGALEQWSVATEVAPDDARGWYNLGFAHMVSEPPNPEAARAAWKKVVELDPDSEMARTVTSHLGSLIDSQSGATAGQ